MPWNNQKTGQKVKGSKNVVKDKKDAVADMSLRQQQLERQDASMAYCKVQLDKDMFLVPARVFYMCYLLLQAVLPANCCCTRAVYSRSSFEQFLVFSTCTSIHRQIYRHQHASTRCAVDIPAHLQLFRPCQVASLMYLPKS